MKANLINRLQSREAVIGIIGMGYVGLPLMLRLTEVGYRVLGMDTDPEKVDKLNSGQSYINHISRSSIESVKRSGRFKATTDFSNASEVDVFIICVPTPLNKHREPDLSYVVNTMNNISPFLRNGQLVSLESTTYPGTTREELKPRIEAKGFKVGVDFFLVYSPEREDPGNPKFTTKNIPKVCGGMTSSCLEVGEVLYQSIVEQVVSVSSPEAAEMTKLLENIHRAVNIGLVNEMKIVADHMGIDIHEVINAAASKPFGFVPYYPGPGLGGHCIPIDPFYLTWKAREYNVHTRFIELAGEVNNSMPYWVVSKTIQALNEVEKPLKGSKILVLGIAYKRNIDDMRESPSVIIMELLRDKGAIIEYNDPFVPFFPSMRQHKFNLSSVDLTAESIAQYDCLVLATDHEIYDYDLILGASNLIIDTRGVFPRNAKNVVRA